MYRLLKIILPILLLLIFIQPALAQDEINLYFFYGDGCSHCAKEEKFLEKLEKENENIKVYRYEVWYNLANAQLLSQLGKELGLYGSGVPILIIGDTVIPGYYSDQTTGGKIKDVINYYTVNECSDLVAPVLGKDQKDSPCVHSCDSGDLECIHNCGCEADTAGSSKIQEKINLPLFGEVKVKDISLPALTIMIAGLDGFNPCAMWVLLFLISLLLGMQDKKRMWIFGSVFIFTSSLVYFLFLSAWLNLFLFLGFIFWIRIIVALIALGSGYYHLKEYFTNRSGTCKVTGGKKRQLVFEKLKNIVVKEKFWLALAGIIVLAAAVNLVELVCSAGLPAVYTQVLSLSNLSSWQYYIYLLLYISIFMLDDLLIFVIAMSTLRMKAISSRYTRWSSLIGGILMLIIGLLLIFKPGWLMF